MSVKKISVYDVGFGDCSLLELDSCNLLVDCGGNIATNKKKFIKDDILNSCIGKALECVITHFHSDHYNIISLFPANTFDAFYAPNFFSKIEIKIQLYALLLLSNASSSYLMAKSMLELIPNLVNKGIIKSNAWIQFVKKGDYINEKNLEVLWPDINYRKGKEIIDTFENSIRDAIRNSIQTPTATNKSFNLNELIETIDSYAAQYSELVQNRGRINGEDLAQYSGEIEGIVERVLNIRNQISHNLSRIKGLPTKRIKGIQNEYSIVFHQYNNNHNMPLLYLGDVSIDVFNKHIKTVINKNKYKYIKVAHHGTKNYFMKDLPECKTMIISSGKRNKCEITAVYPLYYSKQKFVCTNNDNCEFYNAATNFGNKKISLPCKQICNFNTIKEILL